MRASLVYAALAASAVILSACSDGPTENNNFNTNINLGGNTPANAGTIGNCTWVASITSSVPLSNAELTLNVGEKARVTAHQVTSPADCLAGQGFRWSADPAGVVLVVSVDSITGEITAIAKGKTKVCATGMTNAQVNVCMTVTVNGGSNPTTMSIGALGPFQSGTGCSLTFQAQINPTGTAGTWSITNGTGVTVNGSTGAGSFPSGFNGTFTLVFTPQTGTAVSIPVQVNATNCSTTTNRIVSVTVTPNPFTGIVGTTTTFTASVVTEGTISNSVSWSISNPACGTISPNAGNTLTVSWAQACTSVTITATATADASKSGNAVGSVNSGTVTCSFTSSVGQQADGSILLSVGQTAVLTGSCTNQFGAQFVPYWRTRDHGSSVVTVLGATTTIQIGTQTYHAGPQATIKGIAAGTDGIVMQANISDATVLFTRDIRIQ